MKILLASCNINHHQAPFIISLKNRFGDGNVYYATEKMIETSRQKMGFNTYQGEWIVDIKNERDKFEKLWQEADVVFYNLREYIDLVEYRLNNHKYTFYYSERWFKEPGGLVRLLKPHMWKLLIQYRKFSKSNYFYYLPQGSFAYKDLAQFGICRDSSFAFGYITPKTVLDVQNFESRILPENKTNIIWAGSLFKLKRVDLLAKAFCRISQKYNNVHLTIIGDGPEKDNINRILAGGCKQERYTIVPFVNNKKLRQIMAEADIYVFPSNGAEGWGAVVNEAMVESCAVVLSSKVGSISMIDDLRNGLIFKNGSLESLLNCLEKLLSDNKYLDDVKNKARETIIKEWNPDNAAEKFLQLYDQLVNGDNSGFRFGVFRKLS